MARARSTEAKLARREQILSAAVRLLGDEPYEALTMASVARAAGLGKGTPYLYWRSRRSCSSRRCRRSTSRSCATSSRPCRPRRRPPRASARCWSTSCSGATGWWR
ncbi:MAG: helix-turn-helix domain-containing protein [Myxococcota bacterium]